MIPLHHQCAIIWHANDKSKRRVEPVRFIHVEAANTTFRHFQRRRDAR